jgi:hypothetical protein
MLILEVLLGLKSKQGDVTAAFLHALLGPNEHIYCEMPLGFRIPGKVLKLKKTLYGLHQSPCAFWKYLVEKMEIGGMAQSKLDPCLFVGEKVICISYVGGLVFWACNEKDIHHITMKLREVGFNHNLTTFHHPHATVLMRVVRLCLYISYLYIYNNSCWVPWKSNGA